MDFLIFFCYSQTKVKFSYCKFIVYLDMWIEWDFINRFHCCLQVTQELRQHNGNDTNFKINFLFSLIKKTNKV